MSLPGKKRFLNPSPVNLLKKAGIFCIIIIIFLLYFFAILRVSLSHRQILGFDLSQGRSIETLSSLLTSKNLYQRAYARERLTLSSYEDLRRVLSFTRNKPSLISVFAEIDDIINLREKEQQFLLEEDVLLNRAPLKYSGRNQNEDLSIRHLNKQREYLYPKELTLNYAPTGLYGAGEDYYFKPRKITTHSNPTRKSSPVAYAKKYALKKVNQPIIRVWDFLVPEDFLNNWFFWDMRQWIKQYEESALSPVAERGVVYLRNENRLFCLDQQSGGQLWSLDFGNDRGEQYYQTYRHPHQNSFGYEMLVEPGRIYTESRGSLFAVNVDQPVSARILWETSLGQYTVCIAPVRAGNLIIVGLINAKGELWVAGFNDASGVKEWERYIGISSFLSPVSTLRLVCDKKVYLSSNNGVIICLDSRDGSIYWLRKYTPKKQSLFNYWFKGFYNGIFTDNGSIAFDTQFITLSGDDLFLKSRESDFLYRLEAETGALRDTLLIDQGKYIILGMNSESGVFIEKSVQGAKDSTVVIRTKTGSLLEKLPLAGGELKGVVRKDNELIIFKKGEHIYGIDMLKHAFYDYGKNFPKQGWLIFSDGSIFIIGGKQRLAFFRNDAPAVQDKTRSSILDIRRVILERLQAAVTSENRQNTLVELAPVFHDQVFPLQELVEFIIRNDQRLSAKEWQGFFEYINSLRFNEVITYNDVQMRFGRFLSAKGLIRTQDNIPQKTAGALIKPENLNIHGEQIDLLTPEVISGSGKPDFTLPLFYDQMACVNEDGSVRWLAKVFYHPVEDYQTTKKNYKNVGRIYTGHINAYLFDDVLITNDQVNVVARNIHTGEYLWSMTNSGEDFVEQKMLPVEDKSQLYRKYKVSRDFLAKCNIFSFWQRKRLFLIHKNVFYELNPSSGFVKDKQDLPINDIMSITGDGAMNYAISAGAGQILSIDSRNNRLRAARLNFDVNPDAYYQIAAGKNYLVFFSDESLYVLKKGDFSFVQKIDLAKFSKPLCAVQEEGLILMDVFKQVRGYRFTASGISLAWEHNLSQKSFDSFVMSKYDYKNQFYYLVKDYLIVPTMNEGFLEMVALRVKDGKAVFKWPFSDLRGTFYSLSNLRQNGNKIYFIASTVIPGDPEGRLRSVESMSLIFPKLIEIDLVSGKAKYAKEFPPVGGLMDSNLENSILTETQHLDITLSNGSFSMELK